LLGLELAELDRLELGASVRALVIEEDGKE
jgi:hypothetical protein